MSTQIERQIELEQESVALGQERYFKHLGTAQTHGTEDRTRPVMALMRRLVSSVKDGIELIQDQDTKKRGRSRAGLAQIREIEPEVLAFLTLRSAFASISTKNKFAVIAIRIGTTVLEEINFRKFRQQEEKTYKITQEHLKKATSGPRQRKIMSRMFRLSEIDPVEWSNDLKAQVGALLLDCMIQSTDAFTTKVIMSSRNRRERVLEPTKEIVDFLQDGHDTMSLLCPVRLPMLVQPRGWSSVSDGGYLTDMGGRMSLIKTRNHEYLDTLDMVDLDQLFDAVNEIQSTAWRVNAPVLGVMDQLWSEGAQVGDLPSRDAEPIPAVPGQWEGKVHLWRKEDYDGYKIWAQRAAAIHEGNSKLKSKRMATQEKIAIARRFQDEQEIYFPHVVDFRGRAYPVPIHLNPQGDDIAKALLTFADGKPLGEDGWYWLFVHMANCAGVDKVSFEARVEWTQRHLDDILLSAMDPMENTFWMEADEPFQALACAFEILGWSIEGAAFVSHLPIPMDGSCNGLQNFSALLKDGIGGKATNLVPSDAPADIYMEVAGVVKGIVDRDAQLGNPYAIMFAPAFADKATSRKLVKQPVMTQPYGATRNGMRSQIESAVRKMGNPMSIHVRDMWAACGYLAEVVYEAIGQVVVAARQAMDWLQEVARLAASEQYPVRWTSPVGLPVLQEYKRVDAKRVIVHLDGQRQEIHVNTDRDQRLDKRRQAAGISPNLIHSFDASHMMLTTLLAAANGITSFSMIHDSFGTHACDTSALHACIRESFVEMYNGNLLETFRNEIAEQLPPDLVAKLPPLPTDGDLDLEVVKTSRYFFA